MSTDRAPRVRALLAGLGLVTLVLTGCEAPLAPDSKKQDDPAAAPSASTAPRPSASPGQPTEVPTTAPAAPTPSITVPKIPKPRDLGNVLGGDISWPQCPKGMGIPEKRSEGLPLPDASARFVVIGLTNGPGFVANPCLASQLAWAKGRHLLVAAYSVISGPSRFSPSGVTGEELGRRQAEFNIASMKKVGFQTPIVWLDVEPVPHFEWSSDTAANAAVVRGAAKAYTEAGYPVGVYSTPYLWDTVVGDLALRVPEWRAAGQTSREEALRRCGRDWVIQGGKGVLGQWVADQRDRNVTCPGASAQMLRWFHPY
jgi:hypothetical protein